MIDVWECMNCGAKKPGSGPGTLDIPRDWKRGELGFGLYCSHQCVGEARERAEK